MSTQNSVLTYSIQDKKIPSGYEGIPNFRHCLKV